MSDAFTITATGGRGGRNVDSHSTDYREYMGSPTWGATRQMAFAAHGAACQECGATENLAVHHLHYDTLGRERPEDLRILCPPCHARADAARARGSEQRSAEALYRGRLNGWASRKYGEDWYVFRDADAIEEEFDRWLEDHRT
jgi:hypothetical protein